jgi:hypothetical protein
MSNFIVTIEVFDELSEEEKGYVSDNGCGKEYATYIRVKHHGKTILLESDAVEPEDATFYRDFSWIPRWLTKSYELGLKESK